jgi:hypothetical protein
MKKSSIAITINTAKQARSVESMQLRDRIDSSDAFARAISARKRVNSDSSRA